MDWKDLITPGTVNLILGKRGRGKSALGYYLLELIAPVHQLVPVVVNFPRERQSLLPDSYVVQDLEDALQTENAAILVDEGTTQLPAGNKLEELIKACSSLSRQRNQVLFFIFHASRDVGSRILRGVDTVMIKEPSRRQIEQGSKDKWFRSLLGAARQEIRAIEGERRGWTYVDADDPEFRGLMENPLPAFWTDELSKVWKGVVPGVMPKPYDLLQIEAQQQKAELPSVYMCQECNRWAYMAEAKCEFCEAPKPG